MIFDLVFGKKWRTLNEAFYGESKSSTLRGAYWFWFAQGYNGKPNICIMLQRIGLKHTINGVKTAAGSIEKNDSNCTLTCWYYKDGEVSDMFIDNGNVTLSKKRISVKTDEGYDLEVTGDFPKYGLILSREGKNIFTCHGKHCDLSNKNEIIYDREKARTFLDNKNRAYELSIETFNKLQLQFLRLNNVFAEARMNFMGETFDGFAYSERNDTLSFLPPFPWKYAIFSLNDGSFFRLFRRTRFDFNITFDCVKNGKRYSFWDASKMSFYYLDGKNRRSKKMHQNSKKIIINLTEGDKKLEAVADIVNKHIYKYSSVIGLPYIYIQIIHNLNSLKITDGKNVFDIDTKRSNGYGEYVAFKNDL